MKIAIYTCITGGYDALPSPEEIDPGIDYLAFTDDAESIPKEWQTRAIPSVNLSNKNTNRYIKILPHKVEALQGYDLTVYIDGRVKVTKDAAELIRRISQTDHELSMFNHYGRTCLYEEAYVCATQGLESPFVIGKQIYRYRRDGYPENNGLFEGTIIMRRNTDKVATFMERWWNEYINHAKRDQISLPYLSWKHNFPIHSLGHFDNNPYFKRPVRATISTPLSPAKLATSKLVFKLYKSLPA